MARTREIVTASKECAREATRCLDVVMRSDPSLSEEVTNVAVAVSLEYLRDFLQAAERRLPMERAIAEDRKRKQCRKVGAK